jgi:hypothetical protein
MAHYFRRLNQTKKITGEVRWGCILDWHRSANFFDLAIADKEKLKKIKSSTHPGINHTNPSPARRDRLGTAHD